MSDELTTSELLGEAWMQLGHSANMVADLPLHLAGDLPKHVRHACLESFMVNAALIASVCQTIADGDDLDLCVMVQALTTAHVETYGRARLDDALVELPDFDEVKAHLLDLLSCVVDGNERLEAVVLDAITRTEPMT